MADAVLAAFDVPDFDSPRAAPAVPDFAGRSLAPSAARAGEADGTGAGALLLADLPAFFVATAGFRAAAASTARDADGTLAAAFLAGTLATGAFFAGTLAAGAAFLATTFFAGAALLTFDTVFFAAGAAFFAAGAAFLTTGFEAGFAAFFATGFGVDFLAAGAAFFAVFFVATSACPSSLEAGKRAVIPCPQQPRQPRCNVLRPGLRMREHADFRSPSKRAIQRVIGDVEAIMVSRSIKIP